MDKLRRRCEGRLRHMTLPDPFDLAELCRTVSEQRGRPLHVRRIPGPPARARPCGIWIATDEDDWIFVDQDTSPLHRQHIVLYELNCAGRRGRGGARARGGAGVGGRSTRVPGVRSGR